LWPNVSRWDFSPFFRRLNDSKARANGSNLSALNTSAQRCSQELLAQTVSSNTSAQSCQLKHRPLLKGGGTVGPDYEIQTSLLIGAKSYQFKLSAQTPRDLLKDVAKSYQFKLSAQTPLLKDGGTVGYYGIQT